MTFGHLIPWPAGVEVSSYCGLELYGCTPRRGITSAVAEMRIETEKFLKSNLEHSGTLVWYN